jgi:hypothetical protein
MHKYAIKYNDKLGIPRVFYTHANSAEQAESNFKDKHNESITYTTQVTKGTMSESEKRILGEHY